MPAPLEPGAASGPAQRDSLCLSDACALSGSLCRARRSEGREAERAAWRGREQGSAPARDLGGERSQTQLQEEAVALYEGPSAHSLPSSGSYAWLTGDEVSRHARSTLCSTLPAERGRGRGGGPYLGAYGAVGAAHRVVKLVAGVRRVQQPQRKHLGPHPPLHAHGPQRPHSRPSLRLDLFCPPPTPAAAPRQARVTPTSASAQRLFSRLIPSLRFALCGFPFQYVLSGDGAP